MENRNRIAYLFYKYFDDKATVQEKKELATYLHVSEEEIKDLMEEAWENYTSDRKVFSPEKSETLLKYVLQVKYRETRYRTIRFRLAIAAGIILVMSTIGAWFYSQQLVPNTPVIASNNQQDHDFDPGSNKAILTLGDGSEIILEDSTDGMIMKQGNASILKGKEGQLKYQPSKSNPTTVVFNTLTTPKAGQYKLLLADGTRVWLNTASSLRYPTEFKGDRRMVELKGEAYFEVAKNRSQAFYVKVGSMEVMVLGTHFNINAYADEPVIKTTLLEGAVKVRDGLQHKQLVPGQEAIVRKGKETIEVQSANVTQAVAWKNGYFHFDRTSLQEMMRQIARWYDVEVSYEGEIPQREFGGEIPRNSKASEVLKILELSKIHYRIEGKQIIVIP